MSAAAGGLRTLALLLPTSFEWLHELNRPALEMRQWEVRGNQAEHYQACEATSDMEYLREPWSALTAGFPVLLVIIAFYRHITMVPSVWRCSLFTCMQCVVYFALATTTTASHCVSSPFLVAVVIRLRLVDL